VNGHGDSAVPPDNLPPSAGPVAPRTSATPERKKKPITDDGT
jgi:hypothetical protein